MVSITQIASRLATMGLTHVAVVMEVVKVVVAKAIAPDALELVITVQDNFV